MAVRRTAPLRLQFVRGQRAVVRHFSHLRQPNAGPGPGSRPPVQGVNDDEGQHDQTN